MALRIGKCIPGLSAVLGGILMTVALGVGAADALAGAPLPLPATRDATPSLGGDIETGKAIAHDRAKGNCVACHMIPGAPSPGTIGPALVAMQVRYPDLAKLRAQIYDPTVANPESAMPPFGRNRLLTEQELNDLAAYIGSL